MTVEMPDHFGGKPIPDDAIDIALAAEKNKKDGNGGFIYVPSIKLYFAKERSHLGKNWYDTHRELHKQNLRMPTIPQFIEFLKYLRGDPTDENTRVYNEITKVDGIAWKIEWLDAKFYAKGDELWVDYNHIASSIEKGFSPQNEEKVEGHLMQDKTPGVSLEYWLNNPTKQGLPQENSEQGDLLYWHPRKKRVAGFIAYSEGDMLECKVDPSYSNSELGVRAVRTSTQNAGEKQ